MIRKCFGLVRIGSVRIFFLSSSSSNWLQKLVNTFARPTNFICLSFQFLCHPVPLCVFRHLSQCRAIRHHFEFTLMCFFFYFFLSFLVCVCTTSQKLADGNNRTQSNQMACINLTSKLPVWINTTYKILKIDGHDASVLLLLILFSSMMIILFCSSHLHCCHRRRTKNIEENEKKKTKTCI